MRRLAGLCRTGHGLEDQVGGFRELDGRVAGGNLTPAHGQHARNDRVVGRRNVQLRRAALEQGDSLVDALGLGPQTLGVHGKRRGAGIERGPRLRHQVIFVSRRGERRLGRGQLGGRRAGRQPIQLGLRGQQVQLGGGSRPPRRAQPGRPVRAGRLLLQHARFGDRKLRGGQLGVGCGNRAGRGILWQRVALRLGFGQVRLAQRYLGARGRHQRVDRTLDSLDRRVAVGEHLREQRDARVVEDHLMVGRRRGERVPHPLALGERCRRREHGAFGGDPFGGQPSLDRRKLLQDGHLGLARGANLGIQRLRIQRYQDAARLHHHPALAAHRAHDAGHLERQDLLPSGLDKPRDSQTVLEPSAHHRNHWVLCLGPGIGRERGRGVGGGLDRITGGARDDDDAAGNEDRQR